MNLFLSVKKVVVTLAAICLSCNIFGGNPSPDSPQVEITGTYGVQIACLDTYHEEISFIVEPGKDKFSGIKHAVNLTADQKKKLRIGVKVKIKGKKVATVKKMMTKGEIRKAMYKHLKNSAGMPLNCKGMSDIISKIAVKGNSQKKAHDHGELQLKRAEDDSDEVEVTIPGHIAVESIQILN